MKKNQHSSDLAARIAAAAGQPAGTRAVPAPALVAATPTTVKPQGSEPAAPVPAKQKRAKPKADSVPITFRPSRALWNKFVLKAAERTREEGRVVSAQQIMLEALERSIL